MGFFSDFDIAVVEACAATDNDDAVVSIIRQSYNGLVSESTIREHIDTIRCGDYDDPYYPSPG